MYLGGVNAAELFLLGRVLMKIGEEALPEPPAARAGTPAAPGWC